MVVFSERCFGDRLEDHEEVENDVKLLSGLSESWKLPAERCSRLRENLVGEKP
jgi:hypothetical protein